MSKLVFKKPRRYASLAALDYLKKNVPNKMERKKLIKEAKEAIAKWKAKQK